MKEKINHSLYEVFKSKDERFDGRVFIGVSSTGIYCRPVCKAKLTKEENCTYYTTPAEAEADGFRPCLICRPELAPGNSKIDSSRTIAARAVKLLEENIADERSIEEVANILGVSDRHLRRVFKEEYNVTPIEYLQTSRLLLAKKLLTDTNISILDVAIASGFGSLRRFNDLFKRQYSLAPSHFRKEVKHQNTKGNKDITIKIGYHLPYRYNDILNFLKSRAIYGIEKIEKGKYYRTVRIKKNNEYITGYIIVSNNEKKSAIDLTISDTLLKVLPQVIGKVKNLFDLNCEPYSIYETLKDVNKTISNSFLIGTRIPGSIDDFEICVRAVIGQLVSVKSATTLLRRMTEKIGNKINTNINGLDYLFPTPEDILKIKDYISDVLGPLGITKTKSNVIKELAILFTSQRVDFSNCIDTKAEMKRLLDIKGIGEWTAKYIAMRTMNDTDILLDSDYAIKKIMENYKLNITVFEKYKPFRSYITIGIWNSLEENQKIRRN